MSAVLDFSFLSIVELEELSSKLEIVKPAKDGVESDQPRRVRAQCLRLCNNSIESIDTLPEVANAILKQPLSLRWIDLSFNEMTGLGEALSSFTEINVLYLHANKISSFKELKCLSGLTKLRSITLHGNPIAEKKSYRLYLIINLPALNQIDFSPITRQDRETAKTWAAANRRKEMA
uniref:Leucine-rich repeat-containing protein 51 n=1 Tax=Florenciella parvula TaxID=236787 RepID=A0A7S2CJX2_9STRA|mmetsp:Transcript_30009/g.61456  ORF Transcript_30009/g.61456 Transcript_30009/m.61456 type:complete len:177 (+) Transcript_30009:140-670(+)|eukprot:CAMPEP_0182522838 /NCGR_PEP_ID=MMETSP1323-20130603/600_1 /TAXON_ID=236787 /ORGANISM="Florenciella parvula, Strain RCC1693" /LENGTH=176 /DNA_ID=CAMNT_0024731063 /DNA_START=131 /DNA_END=661 /DNA_ORIENTATION=-